MQGTNKHTHTFRHTESAVRERGKTMKNAHAKRDQRKRFVQKRLKTTCHNQFFDNFFLLLSLSLLFSRTGRWDDVGCIVFARERPCVYQSCCFFYSLLCVPFCKNSVLNTFCFISFSIPVCRSLFIDYKQYFLPKLDAYLHWFWWTFLHLSLFSVVVRERARASCKTWSRRRKMKKHTT